VELFYKIQKQVEETVSKEEQAMEQNIKTYIQEQKELLREFQIKAYKDRKILWSKISRVIHNIDTSIDVPTPKNLVIQDYSPTNSQAFPSTQPNIVPKQNIDQPAPKIGIKNSSNTAVTTTKEEIKKDDKLPEPVIKETVKTRTTEIREGLPEIPNLDGNSKSTVTLDTTKSAILRRTPGTGSDTIFHLEDELVEQNTEQTEPLVEDNDGEDLIEHIASIQAEAIPQTATPQTMIPVQPRTVVPASIFGTSVPIVIPQRMTGAKTSSTYVPPATNQLTIAEDENDISFDVPLSSTRRIKGTL